MILDRSKSSDRKDTAIPASTPAAANTYHTRRAFLAQTAASAIGLAASGSTLAAGAAEDSFKPFDDLMASFLREHKPPGAALAVTRHGRLVYFRGFGCADVERQEPVLWRSLFRIASVSKPLTAVAILKLVEQGRLSLGDKVVDCLQMEPLLLNGAQPDPRWRQVTVRHCLQHRGGWDSAASYDPISRPWEIAQALCSQPPVKPADIVRYMLGQPLNFEPGSRFAYSNFGYLILGRIIEARAERSYESFVANRVLAPLGITDMRLGRAMLERRAANEVRYYDAQKRNGASLYPPRIGEQVPFPYGAENFDSFEAHGGWIASAIDLVRFATAFDDSAVCPILDIRNVRRMWRRPPGLAGWEADGQPKAAYYGCGWMVRPVGQNGKFNAWHTGRIVGSEALLVRRWDGLNWAVLFNTDTNSNGDSLADLIDARLHDAADQVRSWPEVDYFPDCE